MKSHLLGYVKFQLSQGYELEDIRQALLKHGYHKDLVDEIVSATDPERHMPKKRKPVKRNLDDELYLYVQNLLVDYIKREQEQGYSIDVIRKALERYGHHKAMIEDAIKTIREGDYTDFYPIEHQKIPSWILLGISFAAYFAVVAFLASSTDTNPMIVALSFSPALAAALAVYMVAPSSYNRQLVNMLPIIAIGIAVLVYTLLSQVSLAVRGISEHNTVLMMNAILAFVLSVLISFFSEKKHKKQEILKELKGVSS